MEIYNKAKKMIDLNDTAKIRELDTSNVAGSIEQLGKQCQHAWEESKKLQIDSLYSAVDKVIVCGMGGSALGSDLIKNIYSDRLNLPLNIVSDYNLPKFVNQDTLVIASSYSGKYSSSVLAASMSSSSTGMYCAAAVEVIVAAVVVVLVRAANC